MQEARSSNPPVVTGVCDRSKSRAGHHCSLNNLVVNKTSVLVQMKTRKKSHGGGRLGITWVNISLKTSFSLIKM